MAGEPEYRPGGILHPGDYLVSAAEVGEVLTAARVKQLLAEYGQPPWRDPAGDDADAVQTGPRPGRTPRTGADVSPSSGPGTACSRLP